MIRNNLLALKPNKVRYNLSDLDHSKKGSPLTPEANQPNVASSSPVPGNIKSNYVHINQRQFIIGFIVVRGIRSRTIDQKFSDSGRYVLDVTRFIKKEVQEESADRFGSYKSCEKSNSESYLVFGEFFSKGGRSVTRGEAD